MQQPHIHVGTSGWTYDDWSGVFYPADVKGAKRLAFYNALVFRDLLASTR